MDPEMIYQIFLHLNHYRDTSAQPTHASPYQLSKPEKEAYVLWVPFPISGPPKGWGLGEVDGAEEAALELEFAELHGLDVKQSVDEVIH